MTGWMPIPEAIKRLVIKEAVAEARLGGVSGDAFLRALCDALQRAHARHGLTQALAPKGGGPRKLS